MSSWAFCNDPEPHDSHEWSQPGFMGQETWTSYYHCPGIRATSELVRLMDARDLARAKLGAAEEALADESVKHRMNVCEFYLAPPDCERPDFIGHEDNYCLGCPRKESAS